MGSFPGSQMHTPRDEDLELDMKEKFDLLHESIIDTYLANYGDLDATIDMNQLLEMYGGKRKLGPKKKINI